MKPAVKTFRLAFLDLRQKVSWRKNNEKSMSGNFFLAIIGVILSGGCGLGRINNLSGMQGLKC